MISRDARLDWLIDICEQDIHDLIMPNGEQVCDWSPDRIRELGSVLIQAGERLVRVAERVAVGDI